MFGFVDRAAGMVIVSLCVPRSVILSPANASAWFGLVPVYVFGGGCVCFLPLCAWGCYYVRLARLLSYKPGWCAYWLGVAMYRGLVVTVFFCVFAWVLLVFCLGVSDWYFSVLGRGQ